MSKQQVEALHETGSREKWLDARIKLLAREKELTRLSDELACERQKLPWVAVEKSYEFDTDSGVKSLADLFGGRSQLIVYHFMFGPDFEAGCPSCSSIADGFNGIFTHLQNHDVAFTAISRAPIEKLQAYRKRMGWSFPWASSARCDFNADFSVYFTEDQQSQGQVNYNYQGEPKFIWRPGQEGGGAGVEQQFAEMCGTDVAGFHRDRPGMSSFAMQADVVHHTYSAYSRGVDALWNMYQWLDRAPLGRNEKGLWFRRHDEYDDNPAQPHCCK